MFSWSIKSRLVWKTKTGLSVQTCANICKHIQAHIGDQGGKCSSLRDFVSFITNTGDVSRVIQIYLSSYLTLQLLFHFFFFFFFFFLFSWHTMY